MEMAPSVAPKKRERDWSNLLPELIGNVVDRLKDYEDNVRFRAVCKNWRSTQWPRVDVLPQRLPWPCLPAGKSINSTWYMSGCRFCNLSKERCYNFKLRGPSRKIYDIPFDGRFIFTSTRDHVTLLNPISGSRITLPPLPGRAIVIRSASCVKCQDEDGVGGFCVIALGLKRTKKFYLYRSVDGYWNEFCDDRSNSDNPATYYKGRVIFAYDVSRCISYDTSTPNVTPILISGSSDMSVNRMHITSFVQSSSGELLMVKFYIIGERDAYEVFRLALPEQQPPIWSRIRSIGNDAIFMDNKTICVDARGIDGCRSNCIYFTNLCPADEVDPELFSRAVEAGPRPYFVHVFLFDIEDERVEKVSNSPHKASTLRTFWIIPHQC